MTRVALVSPYALSAFGGVQEQVLAMSRELSRRGAAVLVVAPDHADVTVYDTPARIERLGRRWSVPANGSRAPLALSPFAAHRAREVVSAFRPDVIHFHEPFAPFLGWYVVRAHAYAAVATFHRSGDGPALRLTRPVLARLARGLDVSAVVSPAAAITLESVVPLHPVVLYNGFEVERFIEVPREVPDVVTVVCVGRLEERKGVATVVDAVRRHNDRRGDRWRLVVVGDGPQRDALAARVGDDDAITFLGAVDDVVKRTWLRRASVVVAAATRGESFGLVILEAMASEVPVVASDIPGYREAAAGFATLFAPGNADALERAIVTALSTVEPDRVAAARSHAQGWSMSSLVDRYEELYDRARGIFRATR